MQPANDLARWHRAYRAAHHVYPLLLGALLLAYAWIR